MSFLRRFFKCCQPDLTEDDQQNIDLTKSKIFKKRTPIITDQISFDQLLFDSKYIRDDEKEHITFVSCYY